MPPLTTGPRRVSPIFSECVFRMKKIAYYLAGLFGGAHSQCQLHCAIPGPANPKPNVDRLSPSLPGLEDPYRWLEDDQSGSHQKCGCGKRTQPPDYPGPDPIFRHEKRKQRLEELGTTLPFQPHGEAVPAILPEATACRESGLSAHSTARRFGARRAGGGAGSQMNWGDRGIAALVERHFLRSGKNTYGMPRLLIARSSSD